MDIKDSILGNASDAEWKERLEGAQIDWLELDQWDAQKNRFRRETQGGRTLAVALERVCVQMGLSIPDDLSIISFNNSILAQLTTPQLTSVDVNSLQLGYEAASQIANHADNPNLMASKIIVPHRIVVRGSCKAI